MAHCSTALALRVPISSGICEASATLRQKLTAPMASVVLQRSFPPRLTPLRTRPLSTRRWPAAQPCRRAVAVRSDAGGLRGEIEGVEERVRELEECLQRGRAIQERLLLKAQVALAKDDDEAARAALVQKRQASVVVEETEEKLEVLRRLRAMLQDEQASKRGSPARVEEEWAEAGSGAVGGMQSSPLEELVDRGAAAGGGGGGPWRPRKSYEDLAAFLPQLTSALLALRPVQRVWSNPLQALSSLRELSAAQQRSQFLYGDAADLALQSWDDLGGPEPSGEAARGRQDALFAVRLLENVYMGPDSLTWFAELSDEGQARGLRILKQIQRAEKGQPAWCMLRSAEEGEVVVCVRGTDEVTDILTAAEARPAPLVDGACHRGAHMSACWLAEQLRPLLARHARGRVHLVGHSLGGAVVAAVAALLEADPAFQDVLPPGASLRVTTFGCPPAFQPAPALLQILQDRVASYVNGDDIVARLSEHNVEVLLAQAEQCQRVGAEQFGRLILEQRNRLFSYLEPEAGPGGRPGGASGGAGAGRADRARASLQRSASFVYDNTSSDRLVVPGRIWLMQVVYGVPRVGEVSGELLADDCIPLLPNSIRDHRLFAYRETLELCSF